jgi:hypothetical protein
VDSVPVLSRFWRNTRLATFSARPRRRAVYSRAVLDIQDLEDFRNAVATTAGTLTAADPFGSR